MDTQLDYNINKDRTNYESQITDNCEWLNAGAKPKETIRGSRPRICRQNGSLRANTLSKGGILLFSFGNESARRLTKWAFLGSNCCRGRCLYDELLKDKSGVGIIDDKILDNTAVNVVSYCFQLFFAISL